MKISVDGGGLGVKKGEWFGNYIFSKNLIEALKKFDKKNKYYFYTFDKIKPKFLWLKFRLSLEELREKKDVFLALNQAIPFYVSGKVITFCHGLSYYFYPNLYSLKDNLRLRDQLSKMILRSDTIIVSSKKVKKELEQIIVKYLKMPGIEVIPFGIPFNMLDSREAGMTSIQKVGRVENPYFLFVGMDHPIKNIGFIKKTFNEFRKLRNFKNYQLKIITKNCPRKKLKKLYQNAAALLTASLYESFNLPVLEALSQGIPVIGMKSAIIPELAPFVNIAESKNDFIKLMQTIPNKPNGKTLIQLKKKFNWEKYIEKLIKLY